MKSDRYNRKTQRNENDKEKIATPTVVTTRERDVITYAELWHTSDCLLKSGQEIERRSACQFMASIVFTAFTLEAYLNHIGPKIFSCWNDLEYLSPKKKLNVIAERLKVRIDYGKRPWQVMKDLFRFETQLPTANPKKISEEKPYPLENLTTRKFNSSK